MTVSILNLFINQQKLQFLYFVIIKESWRLQRNLDTTRTNVNIANRENQVGHVISVTRSSCLDCSLLSDRQNIKNSLEISQM
jgi:hypothetical protein